jgi:hypothetical protein
MTSLRTMTLAIAFTLLAGLLGAQTPPPPQRVQAPGPDPVLTALVTELRALRQEIAEATRASARTQLLLARLQLQEQRIIYLDRQRSELAGRLATTEKERVGLDTMLQQFERASRSADAEERKQATAMLDNFKGQVSAAQAAEDRLRSEESQVLNSLATEQARWNDFNSRLDDLERSLPAR